MKNAVGLSSVLLALLAAFPAQAEIPGFTVNKIDGASSLEGQLDDRFTEDYRINYADCLLYLGDFADVSTDADASSGTGGVRPRFILRWSLTALSGYDYSVKVGSCSDTGGISDEETDACRYVITKTSLDSYTNNELIVDFTDLLPDGCDEGDTGDASLYFFVQYGDDTVTKKVHTVKFSYDFEAPLTPTELSVEGGENNLKVGWTDELNSDEVTYKVYWSDASFDENTIEEAKSKGDISGTSYQIGGLDVGTTYYVGVAAVDEFDNESVLSQLTTGMPVTVSDFWESYKGAGGQEEGGFCFVATAAWGSSMQGAVPILRHFRDEVLVSSAWGRRLVSLYYLYSPPLARFIQKHPTLRAASRVVLAPFVALAWYTVEASPMSRVRVLLTLALAGVLVTWLRRRSLTVGRRAS